MIDFWMAFSSVVIIVGRLVRGAWTRYRWNGRPSADHNLLARPVICEQFAVGNWPKAESRELTAKEMSRSRAARSERERDGGAFGLPRRPKLQLL